MVAPPSGGRSAGSGSPPAGADDGDGDGDGAARSGRPAASDGWLPPRFSPIARLPEGVRDALAERFGIDARALAVLRMALGLLVLADLLLRGREIRVFYTDAGVLPRAAHAEVYPLLARASVHTLTGTTTGQTLLFVLGGGLAVATVVGYRTRVATTGTLLVHASLYARNPYVLNGGDGILVLALFLGVFLPLGARWSVDAVRAARRSVAGPPGAHHRVLDLATVTILLQLVAIYTANALFKYRSDAWTSGQAVRYALELEQFSVLLGPSLTAFPDLLIALNWLWFGMLWLAALLVVTTGWLRVAVVAAFVGAHLGMLATMRLGLFPLVVAALLLLYLPTSVWTRLEAAITARRLDDRLAGAVRTVLDRSAGGRDGLEIPVSVRRGGRALGAVVLALALVTTILWPAAALGATAGTPADRVVETEDYPWTLFAPNPPTSTVWFVTPATLESGAEVDALRGGPVDWSEPVDAADTYPSPLWHRYLNDMRWADGAERHALAAYLCREAGTPSDGAATEVAIYTLERPIDAVGGGDVERTELYRLDCTTLE